MQDVIKHRSKPSDSRPVVLIAGATGYLGKHLIRAYSKAGYKICALARNPDKLVKLDQYIDKIIFAEATSPESIQGVCEGVDLVVSAIGITRQMDGLTYADVDYRANHNLLEQAIAARVKRFAYIHVLNAEKLEKVPMVRAKQQFAQELEQAPIPSTILCPSGFFSDLEEVLEMARGGRIYLLGSGTQRISPISGEDMAQACVDYTKSGARRVDIGGPVTLSHLEMAELAFHALGKPSRITRIPFWLARPVFQIAKALMPNTGAIAFFLAASQLDMSAPPHGSMLLNQHFHS